MALSASWHLWLTENYLAGVAPARCRSLWQEAGLADFDRHWAQLESDPWVQGARTHFSRLRKRQSVLASLARLRGPIRLTRLGKSPSPTRLSADFVQTHSPVVFPTSFDETDWWKTLFAKKSSQRIQCYRHPENEDLGWELFLAEIQRGRRYSVRAHNRLLAQSEFKDLAQQLPATPFQDFQHSTLWIQPPKDFTGFHFDAANQLWTVLEGAKKIWLAAPYDTEMLYPEKHFSPIDPRQPNLSKYPKYLPGRVVAMTLKPGQWLLVPSAVWHAVETLQPSLMLTYAMQRP